MKCFGKFLPSVRSSSKVPFTCEKHHCTSPPSSANRKFRNEKNGWNTLILQVRIGLIYKGSVYVNADWHLLAIALTAKFYRNTMHRYLKTRFNPDNTANNFSRPRWPWILTWHPVHWNPTWMPLSVKLWRQNSEKRLSPNLEANAKYGESGIGAKKQNQVRGSHANCLP